VPWKDGSVKSEMTQKRSLGLFPVLAQTQALKASTTRHSETPMTQVATLVMKRAWQKMPPTAWAMAAEAREATMMQFLTSMAWIACLKVTLAFVVENSVRLLLRIQSLEVRSDECQGRTMSASNLLLYVKRCRKTKQKHIEQLSGEHFRLGRG